MTPKLLIEIEGILNENTSLYNKLEKICAELKANITHYDWVGYYFANHEKRTLHLGPYVGDETDHTTISFGKGICGQVAESNQTFLVEDVKAQDNYIACSIHVKSEIVVPLFVNNVNMGQIDIDSHTVNAFSHQDEEFLKEVNTLVATFLEKNEHDLLLLTSTK